VRRLTVEPASCVSLWMLPSSRSEKRSTPPLSDTSRLNTHPDPSGRGDI
jgi:hypothetical protein